MHRKAGKKTRSRSHLKNFNQSLISMVLVIWFKRVLHLVLRSMWLGIGGFLLYWGLIALSGHVFNFTYAVVATSLMFLPFLVAAFIFRPNLKEWTWKIDRAYELKEQISTALEVSAKRPLKHLEFDLIKEATPLLSIKTKQIWKSDWLLGRELTALMVVILLLSAVILLGKTISIDFKIERSLTSVSFKSEPKTIDVFPNGMAWKHYENDQKAIPPIDLRSFGNTMSNLGDELMKDKATNELGKAIQQMDIAKTTAALAELAENIDALPEESRINLVNALGNAAPKLNEMGLNQLAESPRGC
jgi:hypothetical protein